MGENALLVQGHIVTYNAASEIQTIVLRGLLVEIYTENFFLISHAISLRVVAGSSSNLLVELCLQLQRTSY